MNKTKIEYADYSWNPIKGICPVACWYCYARKIYQRFNLNPEPLLDIHELMKLLNTKITNKRIFVCSTFELFHPITLNEYHRGLIFQVIKKRPDLTFIILTKMPENIDRPMPPNVWLGVSLTCWDDYVKKNELMRNKATIHFISYEPILSQLPAIIPLGLDWAIMGRLTGHGNKHDPTRTLLKSFVWDCKNHNVPIFMKNNLKDIWKGPLIQEFPRISK